jgi:hypothetical protein
LRDKFEVFGEQVISLALALGESGGGGGGGVTNGSPPPIRTQAVKLVFDHPDDAAAWLRERRDLQERHETRLEVCEWAILIFVVLSVVVAGDPFPDGRLRPV